MTIIVDLDHTLLNTTVLKLKMLEAVEQFGVTNEQFDATYDETVTAHEDRYSYDANTHGKLLAQVLNKPELADQIARALYDSVEKTPNLVYEDVIPFLQQAKQAGATIILLTRGDPAWQNHKIDVAGLRQLVKRVVIVETSKGEVLRSQIRPDSKAFFLTDNAKEIEGIEGIKMQVIQIIRPEGRYKQQAENVPVVNTLIEAWNRITTDQ